MKALGNVPVVCQKSFVPLYVVPQVFRCKAVLKFHEFPAARDALPKFTVK